MSVPTPPRPGIQMPDTVHVPQPARRLLDQVRDRIRTLHYSPQTAKSYTGWIRKFILYHNKRHPREMGVREIENYLSFLAVHRSVSPSTQNQAFNAILFLYKQVLHIELEQDIRASRARKSKRLPVVLSRKEVASIMKELNGVAKLMAQLMYGCGLRSIEVNRLRVQDIDFEHKKIMIREAKGNKDRVTFLPDNLTDELLN